MLPVLLVRCTSAEGRVCYGAVEATGVRVVPWRVLCCIATWGVMMGARTWRCVGEGTQEGHTLERQIRPPPVYNSSLPGVLLHCHVGHDGGAHVAVCRL